MTSLILAITLISRNPYDWNMTCTRWHESRIEIMNDKNLDYRSKLNLIRYFRTKVRERCDDTFI